MQNGTIDATHEQPSVKMVVALLGQALSDRLLLWFALLGSTLGFGYAIYDPVVLRLISACSFALLVLLPILWETFRRRNA